MKKRDVFGDRGLYRYIWIYINQQLEKANGERVVIRVYAKASPQSVAGRINKMLKRDFGPRVIFENFGS
jgi:hypothetical protein